MGFRGQLLPSVGLAQDTATDGQSWRWSNAAGEYVPFNGIPSQTDSHFADVNIPWSADPIPAYYPIPNQTWWTVPLNTVVTDPEGLFDLTTHEYVVPESGTYMQIGKVRLTSTRDEPDPVPLNVQWAIGIHTVNADGPWVTWDQTPPSAPTTGNMNARAMTANYRTVFLNAGDRVRLFVFFDSTLSNQAAVMDAALNIWMVARAT